MKVDMSNIRCVRPRTGARPPVCARSIAERHAHQSPQPVAFAFVTRQQRTDIGDDGFTGSDVDIERRRGGAKYYFRCERNTLGELLIEMHLRVWHRQDERFNAGRH